MLASSPKCLRPSGAQRSQQLYIGCVMAQFPEHYSTQMLLANIGHFLPHRLRTVIAPVIAIVPDCAGGGLLVVLAVDLARKLLQLAIASACLGRSRRALIQAVI